MNNKNIENPNFLIICRRCGNREILVDAYQYQSMITSSGVMAFPLLICEECENEYNGRSNTNLENDNDKKSI